MGHLLSSKSSLVPLIDRLNQYPIGLVDSDILRKILSILFSDEEALIASKFPLEESTLEELVTKTNIPGDQLLPVLESMADKGLVMDMPYSGKTYYLLMPGLIGFMEFTFMRNNTDLPMKELAQLMTDYLKENGTQGQAGEFFGSQSQLTRALVYEDQIPTNSQITSYEDAKQIINNASYCAVTMCYCRHKKEHLGINCKKKAPVDGICMVLGSGARFLVRRGFAEEKTSEELLDILQEARKLNLTHVTDNIRSKPSFVCNCCHCCCELMAGIQMGFEDGLAKTPFIASIDSELCDYCGKCVKACNVNCIEIPKKIKFETKEDRYAEVGASVCLGCGACLPVCEQNAISLYAREKHTPPPKSKKDLFINILKEKRRLKPFIISRLKKTIRHVLHLN